MERLRLGNGKWETAKYNERLQVTQIGLGNSSADTSLLKLEFDYGNNTQNNGSMRSQKISFNGLSQPFEQTYAYDDLNRLQSATETINIGATTTWKQTFQYDRFGNRRLDAANTTTIGVSNKVTNPLINTSDNRLKKDQDGDAITDYDYDKTGNLTQDSEGKQFLYDAENHQKEVFVNGVSKGKYLYDGEGRRVKKISDLETTIFVYNGGGQLVAEYSTQQSSTPQVSYLTQDHLGSPRIITDSTGKVIARKDFNAFGDETNSAQRTELLGYKPEELRQDYTGYQKDDETGLEFAQARYYNNKHGRFTSVDPMTASANVKDPQTFNRYSYAMNSPYKFADPLGLIAQHTNNDEYCGAENSICSDSNYWGGDGAMPQATDMGGDTENTSQNLVSENESVTISLNFVYNTTAFTLAQAKEFVKKALYDLTQNTMQYINVYFSVTYSEGTAEMSSKTNKDCQECAYKIKTGAKEGAVNVYLYDRSYYQLQSTDSMYIPETKQIFLSRGGKIPLDDHALAHEMGHLFRDFSGIDNRTGFTLTIDGKTVDAANLTEDAIINSANSWLRTFNVSYGRDYVDDYTIVSPLGERSRSSTILDTYRLGARRVASQKK
jgi:RHS repeat-associated protein